MGTVVCALHAAQNFPERAAGSRQSRTDRSNRDAEEASDLGVLEPFYLPQHERAALTRGKVVDGEAQLGAERLERHLLRRVAGGYTICNGHAGTSLVMPAPAQGAANVETAMDDRAREPGPRVAGRCGCLPQRQKTLLHRIPGEVVAAHEAARQPYHVGDMGPNMLRERGIGSRVRRLECGLVAERCMGFTWRTTAPWMSNVRSVRSAG
jgi:hypothetical protein